MNATSDEPDNMGKLRAAAEKGDAKAQHDLGMTLLCGNREGLVLEGLDMLERAAFNQHEQAVYSLAVLLLTSPKADELNKSIARYMLKSIGSCEADVTNWFGPDILDPSLFWKVALNFGYRLIEPESQRGINVLTVAANQGSTLAIGLLAQFHLAENFGQGKQ